MKNRGFNNFIFLILIALIFFGCRREYGKLKSSTRRISSELRYLERGSSALMSSLGITDNTEIMDTSVNQMAPISQKTFINEFDFLYDALNGKSTNLYLQSWEYDSLESQYKRTQYGSRSLNEEYEVYTWYPAWMGDSWKSYDFKLISSLSFFSFKIDANTGSYLNPEEIDHWRSSELLDSAKKYNTNVLLTLAFEGNNENLNFFDNEKLWNVTLDSVSSLLKQRGADGIELDFTKIPENRSDKFLEFIIFMRDNLDYRFLSEEIMISLILPLDPDSFYLELNTLDEFVDLFIVRGLDYYEIDETNSAVAPMRTGISEGYSLEKTLKGYLENGLKSEKSILSLPLYGVQWSGNWDPNEGYYETGFDKKITLSEVSTVYQTRDSSFMIVPNLDELSMTKYFFLEFPDGSSVDCWFDDSYTLSKKIDLALVNNFKGVGLWALGYDKGIDDIWMMVGDKFASDEVFIKDPIAEIEGYPIRFAILVEEYEKLFMVTVSFLTIILFFTMAIAFSDWRFRDTILARQLYRIIFLSIFISLIIPIFSFLGILEGSGWQFVIIFLLGAISSYLIERFGGLVKIEKP